MAKASWKGKIIAESKDCVVVEGNQYFPRDSVRKEYLRSSNHQSVCPWKGTASYYDLVVDGHTNANAAWYYPSPSEAAKDVANRIAFWKGVQIED